MTSSTLYSIEDKSKTNTFKTTTISFIIFLIISLFLIIIVSNNGKASSLTILFSSFVFILLISIIGIPFFLSGKKYATSMMINQLGVYTFNSKNDIVETILYENILIIQLYDASGRDTLNPNLRIKVNNNGTAIWKTFPKLYYVGLTNKNELHLHFLLQAKSSQKKIEIDTTAIIYYQSLIKK
ncbi:hypothetical protein [Empedobacter sp. GD03797]|uniref:hypothetical protein n=1 Tax=Empedobacter sp. GD03797 TaxID=2975382 RepID=UPI002449BF92|nr:hypothetical protein [Empedobacter sp. GD03797]MDH1883750.1 hypothetical protein [Empedobacter sp. GD03797]